MTMEEYIDREIVKETPKAYLVKQEVNNRRDGCYINFKWVAKNICRRAKRQDYIDTLPDDVKNLLPKYVGVPEWAVSNGIW